MYLFYIYKWLDFVTFLDNFIDLAEIKKLGLNLFTSIKDELIGFLYMVNDILITI